MYIYIYIYTHNIHISIHYIRPILCSNHSDPPRLRDAAIGASIDPHDAGGAIKNGRVHVACHAAGAGEFRPQAASYLVGPNIIVLGDLRFDP